MWIILASLASAQERVKLRDVTCEKPRGLRKLQGNQWFDPIVHAALGANELHLKGSCLTLINVSLSPPRSLPPLPPHKALDLVHQSEFEFCQPSEGWFQAENLESGWIIQIKRPGKIQHLSIPFGNQVVSRSTQQLA